MDKQAIRALAQEFAEALERCGIAALESFNWSERFFELGFDMDGGSSYEDTYGLKLGDNRDISEGLARVDDLNVLGNAVFSQCRYLTHWSNGYSENDAAWITAALKRMEELAEPHPACAVSISYRFADTAEAAIASFCERALSNEELPTHINYSVTDIGALDAYVDEITCSIDLPDGDVYLAFQIAQTSWRCPGQTAEDLEPQAGALHAERSLEDKETGEELTLAWDDEAGAWRATKIPYPSK